MPRQYLEDVCRSALNRVPEGSRLPFRWTVNPYRGCTHSCHYCFARAYHTYLDLGVGEDFATKIVVKTNVAGVLRQELARARWRRETVAMGTATDPYQPCEARYGLTRDVLGALAEARTPVSLLTKSTLAVRDLDLFVELDRRAGAAFAMSVATLDEELRRSVEPGTPPARSRLEVLSRFAQAGIPTGVLIAPILPGLTDTVEQLDPLLAACAKAGVTAVGAIALHLRPAVRDHFHQWLSRAYPRLVPLYRELYGGRTYAPERYRRELAERVHRLRSRHGLEAGPGRPPPRTGLADVQLTLGLGLAPAA